MFSSPNVCLQYFLMDEYKFCTLQPKDLKKVHKILSNYCDIRNFITSLFMHFNNLHTENNYFQTGKIHYK